MTEEHEEAPVGGRWWALPVLVFAAVCLLALVWQGSVLKTERFNTSALKRNRDSLATKYRLTSQERAAFLRVIEGIPLGPVFLRGTRLTDWHKVIDTVPSATLVYVLDPHCAACEANYPDLVRINSTKPGAVEGVTVYQDSSTLAQYQESHHFKFPVVRLDNGRLSDILPRHGTPVSLLFSKGKLTSVISGRLTAQDVKDILLLASQE